MLLGVIGRCKIRFKNSVGKFGWKIRLEKIQLKFGKNSSSKIRSEKIQFKNSVRKFGSLILA